MLLVSARWWPHCLSDRRTGLRLKPKTLLSQTKSTSSPPDSTRIGLRATPFNSLVASTTKVSALSEGAVPQQQRLRFPPQFLCDPFGLSPCLGLRLSFSPSLIRSHVGIWPRGFATSLFGLVLESAGICKTFVVSSQDWGLCLTAPFRYLKVRARFSAHSAQVRGEVGLLTQLATPEASALKSAP